MIVYLLFYVYGFVCESICTTYMASAWEGRKRESDHLGLGLQIVGSHHVGGWGLNPVDILRLKPSLQPSGHSSGRNHMGNYGICKQMLALELVVNGACL